MSGADLTGGLKATMRSLHHAAATAIDLDQSLESAASRGHADPASEMPMRGW
jgi:hypothetical protein